MKVGGGKRYPPSPKVSPHRILIKYKGKNSNFASTAICQHQLNLVIEVSTSNHRTNQQLVTPHMMDWEGQSNISGTFLPEVHSLSLATRKHQTKLNWASVYNITGFQFSQTSKLKNLREAEELSKLKETKETWWLSTSDPEFDLDRER